MQRLPVVTCICRLRMFRPYTCNQRLDVCCRSLFATLTRGTGILHRAFQAYGPYRGPLDRVRNGVLVSTAGKAHAPMFWLHVIVHTALGPYRPSLTWFYRRCTQRAGSFIRLLVTTTMHDSVDSRQDARRKMLALIFPACHTFATGVLLSTAGKSHAPACSSVSL